MAEREFSSPDDDSLSPRPALQGRPSALGAVASDSRQVESGLADCAWSAPQGEVHDVGLRVRVLGAGPRTLVLLHGLAGSNRYFGAAFDALAASSRLIAPDLLGFGASPRPRDCAYTVEVHAQAVIDALTRIGVEPPLYLGAHSAGSVVALRIAQLKHDWVRGVVAFSPPFYADPAAARHHIARLGLWTRLFAMDTSWLARSSCAVMCHFPRLAARAAVWLRPDLPAPVARDGTQHNWESYSRTLRHVVLEAQPVEPAEVRAPVRLVVGDSDRALDHSHLAQLAREHAHVSLQMARGDHDLPIADAPACIAALRELIEDAEAAPP